MDLALSFVQNQFFFSFFAAIDAIVAVISFLCRRRQRRISTMCLFVCGWCAFVCTRAQLLFVLFFPVARSLSHYYLSLEGFSPVGCLLGLVFGLDGFWNTSLYAHRHWGWGCSSRTQSDRELNNTLFNPAYVWQRYSVHQYTYHFIFAAKHSHTPQQQQKKKTMINLSCDLSSTKSWSIIIYGSERNLSME